MASGEVHLYHNKLPTTFCNSCVPGLTINLLISGVGIDTVGDNPPPAVFTGSALVLNQGRKLIFMDPHESAIVSYGPYEIVILPHSKSEFGFYLGLLQFIKSAQGKYR